MQIICKNFFAKLVQSFSLCHRLSKKLYNYQNLYDIFGIINFFQKEIIKIYDIPDLIICAF